MIVGSTRREALTRAGQTVVGATAAGLVAGCGSKHASPTTTSTEGGSPKRGGTITAGMITGGTSETLDPALLYQWSDSVRGPALYSRLFSANADLSIRAGLALSAEGNRDATLWTFKLRPDVTWHDGKSFSAEDVVAAFHRWSDPKNFNNFTLGGIVDFKSVRKRGPLEVEVPLVRPVAQFSTFLTIWTAEIPQAGSTPASFKTHPIGTGPFKFVSFTPGSRSEFVRNPDYWEEGKPYIDRLVIESSFTDEASRLNALQSGAIDVLPLVPFQEAKRASGQSLKVLHSNGGQNYCLEVRVDKAPFNDVRVRQALKYVIDRQQLVDVAFAGYARPGNNILGEPELKYYDSSVRAVHDPERAKALLKAAGREGLTFTMPIAQASSGFVEAATLFAQQAKQAGINVKLQNIPVAQFYSPTPGNYLSRLVQLDGTPGYPSLGMYYKQLVMTGGTQAASHWGSPAHDAPIYDALGEVDPARAQEKWNAIQATQAEQGGCIVYADADFVELTRADVMGLSAGRAYPLNDVRWQDGWLDKS